MPSRAQPIFMSGPMVRAILEGRKTQTRRVVKPQPSHFHVFDGVKYPCDDDPGLAPVPTCTGRIPCPYGQPGDRLWVRETWCKGMLPETAYYRADWPEHEYGPRWRPSIHMPRWASRITLEVTGVRVERVQEINDKDIYAEGVTEWGIDDDPPADLLKEAARGLDEYNAEVGAPAGFDNGYTYGFFEGYNRELFRDLWDSINAKRGFGWDVNPWVWVVEFRRIAP